MCLEPATPARVARTHEFIIRRERYDESQNDPAGADRSQESVLAADQVLAVSAARTRDARRLLAADDDEVELQDEHVEKLELDDEPDLVVIQVYITSAKRAYAIADHYRQEGAHVALGGLHVTSLPEEAMRHADTIFLGPGEDTWPVFLNDYRDGRPGARLSLDDSHAGRDCRRFAAT